MEDSELTPHILVNCSVNGVMVPKNFIQQDKIVLNISSSAASNLIMNNEHITFKARFDGKSVSIAVPMNAVLTIYAAENGEGMFFGSQEDSSEKKPKPGLKILD